MPVVLSGAAELLEALEALKAFLKGTCLFDCSCLLEEPCEWSSERFCCCSGIILAESPVSSL